MLPLAFTIACTQNKKTDILQPAIVNENVNLLHTISEKPEIPKKWKKIEECGFSFYAPTNFKEAKAQPIDSCATDYRNEDTLFSLDLYHGGGTEDGTRRNEYSGKEDFQISETVIDGRKAEIITYY